VEAAFFVEQAVGGEDMEVRVEDEVVAEDQYLCFRFTRSPGRKDVVIVVEASSSLDNTWTELARSTNGAPFSVPAAVSQTPRDANSPYDIIMDE
jgi:hypothetical protein